MAENGKKAIQMDTHLNTAGEQNGGSNTTTEVLPAVQIADKGKKETEETKVVGFIQLFRFSDGMDKFLMFIGSLAAATNGAGFPVMIITFGKMIDFFVGTAALDSYLDTIPEYLASINSSKNAIIKNPPLLDCDAVQTYYNGNNTCPGNLSLELIFDKMTVYAIWFCVIGAVVMVSSYIQVTCWMTTAERQAHRIRKSFLYNVLRQEIGWFDTSEQSELNTRLSDDVIKIQDGIGDKVGALVQWMVCGLACLIVGFVYGWKLTLVILSISPLLIGTGVIFAKLTASVSTKESEAYAHAGSVAEEVFGAIRTVVAFGGQEKGAQKYLKNLSAAKAFGIKKGFSNGASMGFMWLVMFSSYGLGFWYGGKLTREDDDYDLASVIIVFFAVLISTTALGSATPSLDSISSARGAAYVVFELIDRKSAIDSFSEEGSKPDSIIGTINFQNVHFNYPARPDVKVLKGINIQAKPGQTVALVGSSGCGKSTTVQLLMRFYDPHEGEVMIDGRDIKGYNVKWLREHIGLVSQEPILFASTIAENIRYGRENVTMEEMEQATKQANAYDFIMKLPNKFETLVGERGAQLSGGQKQRLAIARALVRNPKILLLDEATSALDTESESIVQDALDKAREGRTTIVIAHRLSTIKTADIIIGFDEGKVAEMGTHDDLMRKQGIYYQLVTNQQTAVSKEDEKIEEYVEKEKLQRALSHTEFKRQASTKEKEVDEKEEDLPEASFIRIMKMNSPEWFYIVLGCFGSIVNGGVQPAFAIIFSRMINVFSYSDIEKQKDEILMYALMFVGIGVLSLVTYFLQGYMFALSGETLTERLRDQCFRSMLRQDIAYFDDNKNSVGALSTRLSTDASLVQGATGVRLGGALMGVANMGTALVIAFIYGWQLTLVILGFIPIVALSGYMEIKLMSSQAGKNKEALEGAGKVTVESIGNIRTVASLSLEHRFYHLYMENLEVPHKSSLKNAFVVGVMYSFSQGSMFFILATAFVYGAYLIEEGVLNFEDVYLIFSALVFGAIGLGNATAFAPNVGKAQLSSRRIIQIIDSKTTIDYTNPDGLKLQENYNAEVSFKDVFFCYPTRDTVKVLQGLTFSVSPGQTVALVGTSGCGKSTSVQLIERFYNIESGQVTLDSKNLKDMNIQWLREQIGIVSQEPILFDTSIAENVAYGDNTRTVPMDEIVSATRRANIHNFIASLPDGYNTNVGSKGTQLSGGQKQRISIARALVRKPKILLLDEATSALDTESEKIVQEALDKAREGRTCIVIAHRLSTVQTADKICVINQGKVSESGTHSELMEKQGFYYKLVKKSLREI